MDKNVINAIIEIPLHSKNKYEFDEVTGKIKLDRVLYASMIYPTEYGIVEHTLAPDGDALDILVVCDYPTFPGCIVPARVLGYLEMIDGGVVGLVLAAAGLAVGAGALYVGEYALLREIIKDKGKAAALNGK